MTAAKSDRVGAAAPNRNLGSRYSEPPRRRSIGLTKSKGNSSTTTSGGGMGFAVPPALAASVALIVAAVAAVGITGDSLQRVVRNHPIFAALVISAALLAVAVPFFRDAAVAKGGKLAIAILVPVIIVAVTGAASVLSEREQPSITLAPTTDSSGNVTIVVEAHASGLRAQESMLVQVLGLKSFNQIDQEGVIAACETSHAQQRPDQANYALKANDGDLLVWNRVGPTSAGVIAVTLKVESPSGRHQGVCAWAVLSDRDSVPSASDTRTSAAYVRLLP